MGSQAILLFCVGLSAIQTVFGQLWEFGVDNVPTAVVISKYHGEFSFFQKEQHVQLTVSKIKLFYYMTLSYWT